MEQKKFYLKDGDQIYNYLTLMRGIDIDHEHLWQPSPEEMVSRFLVFPEKANRNENHHLPQMFFYFWGGCGHERNFLIEKCFFGLSLKVDGPLKNNKNFLDEYN